MKLQTQKSRSKQTKHKIPFTPDALKMILKDICLSAECVCAAVVRHNEAGSSPEVRAVLEEHLRRSVEGFTESLDGAEAKAVCRIVLTEVAIEKAPVIEMNVRAGKSGVGRMVRQ